jgi:hypothetical protein
MAAPKYKALKKLFDGMAIRQIGEEFYSDTPQSPDSALPIGDAPMLPRRIDEPGTQGMTLLQRSESVGMENANAALHRRAGPIRVIRRGP